MPHSSQRTNSTTESFDSLDSSSASVPVLSLSEDGTLDCKKEAASYQRPRINTLDPLDDLYHQRLCQSFRYSSSTPLPASSQTQVPHHEPPFEAQTLHKKGAAVPSTVLPDIRRIENATAHEQTRPNRMQRLRLHWLTAYRILIGLTFTANIAVLIAWLQMDLTLAGMLQATSANILVAVLVRQEDLINTSFSIIAKTPTTLPLRIRTFLADFHHYGGLHIGCAVSALMWYCLFIVTNTHHAVNNVHLGKMTGWLWADIVTCYAFLTFILFVCVTAHPRLRARFHNTFEHTHRFGGWAALLVLWVNSGTSTKAQNANRSLYQSPSIWLLTVVTCLIILPWLRIRRVPIQAEAVSSREVKLTFPYPNMPYTSTTRFSLSPLMEWHAFATIPSADGFTASIIVSQAGDWTKSIIQNPPREIWIRKPPTANFLAFTPVFNSVLLVATGAGIGPMLSLLKSPAIAKMKAEGRQVRVMWCVYDPDAPHWRFVQETITKVDPMPRIFDSRQGRPDLAFEARYMRHVCDIEAVMVVSNKKVTDDVVREVKVHGGAAYGAVFDS
ncbi:Nn.00g004500.m01.CDS01 [Neocucurbitaria sp. VM-36]